MTEVEKRLKKKKRKAEASSEEEGIRKERKKQKKEKKEKKKKEKEEEEDDNEEAVEIKKVKISEDTVSTRRPRTRSTDETIASYYRDHEIAVQGVSLTPILKFEDAPYNEKCQRALVAAGYAEPTATQAVSWPLALAGYDLISVAKTGSGKTLGFLLPCMHKLYTSPRARIVGPCSPRILILAPTRELATQIGIEANKFCGVMDCRTATVYGGAPKWEQAKQLKTLGGKAVVVGTPGRVSDFLQAGKLSLNILEVLVLDEADRMLDMGFEPQIRAIVEHAPLKSKRQTMLFTATWDKKIQRAANDFTRSTPSSGSHTAAGLADCNLATVHFGDALSGKLVANKDVKQSIEFVEPDQKRQQALIHVDTIYSDSEFKENKLIIFSATKRGADQLARQLQQRFGRRLAIDAIHGDKPQHERDHAMASFKRGEIQVLVATDVAARGLDVSDVSHVLILDFPDGSRGIEDYVHRIGRTGRAGKTGYATCFFTKQDAPQASALIKILKDANQSVPPELQTLANLRRPGKSSSYSSHGGRGRGRGGRAWRSSSWY